MAFEAQWKLALLASRPETGLSCREAVPGYLHTSLLPVPVRRAVDGHIASHRMAFQPPLGGDPAIPHAVLDEPEGTRKLGDRLLLYTRRPAPSHYCTAGLHHPVIALPR